MEEEEEIEQPEKQKKEVEISNVFKNLEKNIGEQPVEAREQVEETEQFQPQPVDYPTEVIVPGTEVQIQQDNPILTIPLIKKRGRPKKLVIREEIPLQVENIQSEAQISIIPKKRGRPKKDDKK